MGSIILLTFYDTFVLSYSLTLHWMLHLSCCFDYIFITFTEWVRSAYQNFYGEKNIITL